jgi:branched-chain amino acid transport system permease protein
VETLIQAIVDGLGASTLYVMLSLGLTLIFGVLGVMNFAQGDFMTLAAYLGVASITGWSISTIGTLAIMVPALAALGVAFFFVLLRPTERLVPENQLLATFGLAFFIQGAVEAIWGADPISARQSTGAVDVAGIVFTDDLLRNLALVAVAVACLVLFLRYTRTGLEIRATAQSTVGAELVGVKTTTVKLVATVVGCALTAVGGLMLFTTNYIYPQAGFAVVLNGFAIVILGGLGSVSGAVFASLLLGIATSLVSTYIDTAWSNVVPFVVMMAALLVRPQGLMGAVVK